MKLHVDAVATTTSGLRVVVIGLDSDPDCPVLTVREDNPDVMVSVAREDLTVIG